MQEKRECDNFPSPPHLPLLPRLHCTSSSFPHLPLSDLPTPLQSPLWPCAVQKVFWQSLSHCKIWVRETGARVRPVPRCIGGELVSQRTFQYLEGMPGKYLTLMAIYGCATARDQVFLSI